MPATAGSIAEFIAPYVGCSWPNDERKIFELMSLVQNKIWQSGKFHNSTKFFYVNVRSDRTIITPHGYNVLLGCNINFQPVNINSPNGLFHRNGPSEAPMVGGNFNTTIQYLGESPVTKQPNEAWCSPCGNHRFTCDNDYFITVVGENCSTKAHTLVSALGKNNKPIYTYYKEETGGEPTVCESEDIAATEIKYNEGVRYPILGQKVFYKDILVTNIYNIIKEPSLVPVEYYLTERRTGIGSLIARLEPYEIISKYKRYQISNNCIRKNCVLALFKQSKPVDIVSESQIFISDNKDAILCMAQGIYQIHEKQELNLGNGFIQQGLVALREELREESPNTNDKLQIESIRDYSKIKDFQ